MKCPNCGKEMKKSTKYVDKIRVDDGFWTETYIVKRTRYSCTECKIKCAVDSESCQDFDENDYDKDDIEWELPKELTPSDKQIKYAKSIGNYLGLDTDELVTKQQYWDFINTHQTEFKNQKSNEYSHECDEYEDDMYELDEWTYIGYIPGDS